MAANQTFHGVQSLNREVKIMAGSFAPAGSGVPTDVKGRGFTVVRTSTGLFTVTLSNTFIQLLDGQVSLQLASADDKFAQLGAVDLAAKTVQIRIWDISAAAVADVAANANNRVNFALALRNSTVA